MGARLGGGLARPRRRAHPRGAGGGRGRRHQAVAPPAGRGDARRRAPGPRPRAPGRRTGRRRRRAAWAERLQGPAPAEDGGARAPSGRGLLGRRDRMNVELKVIGQPINRVDGPRKVTGEARYAAEFDLPDLLHGALVLATVPAGTIAAIDAEAARRAPGVYAVITHENAPRLPYKPYGKRPQVDAQSGDQLQVFQDARIHFNGQPVAVVVAETLEQAAHAADLVRISYDAAPGLTTFDPARAREPSRGNEKA